MYVSCLRSPPSLVQHHGLLHDELTLLVLLALLVGEVVLPPQQRAAGCAKDVPHGVQPGHQEAVLLAAECYVGDVVEEVRAAVAALERLRGEGDDEWVSGRSSESRGRRERGGGVGKMLGISRGVPWI